MGECADEEYDGRMGGFVAAVVVAVVVVVVKGVAVTSNGARTRISKGRSRV